MVPLTINPMYAWKITTRALHPKGFPTNPRDPGSPELRMVSLVSVNDRSTAFSYVSGGERKDTLRPSWRVPRPPQALIILRTWRLIPRGGVEGNIYQATYLNKWNHFPTSPRNAFTRASSVPRSVHKPWWKKNGALWRSVEESDGKLVLRGSGYLVTGYI